MYVLNVETIMIFCSNINDNRACVNDFIFWLYYGLLVSYSIFSLLKRLELYIFFYYFELIMKFELKF